MVMYIQEIGRMLAEPNWAADTAPWPALGRSSLPVAATTWSAMKGARWAFRPIGPMPGPPPPGMQKVLCRFMWLTSAPMVAGGEADLGVEVGAVHVHLAAVLVHGGADLADGFLEHAVWTGR
jgi:hypothetical protein